MRRPAERLRFFLPPACRRSGFTLVEVLTATLLTLILMYAVVQVFGMIGENVSNARTVLEASDRLRAASTRLQQDLQGLTVISLPPRGPGDGNGYFELIEGTVHPASIAIDRDRGGIVDDTVSDFDDRLMFTSHNVVRPFLGKCTSTSDGTIESDTAEIVWFVRRRTLYRRVLLVAPGVDLSAARVADFYDDNVGGGYDISARIDNSTGTPIPVANTLDDLCRRECRFGHATGGFPYDARGWKSNGFPTFADLAPLGFAPTGNAWGQYDFWRDAPTDPPPGTSGARREGEDIILTNVIGFDVKVWDPGAGRYVNLGEAGAVAFAGTGLPASKLHTGNSRVYCTWSFHYEHDGEDQDGTAGADQGTNGFDDNVAGGVDDASEWETAPPYPVPLRGIQVRIRVFEPESRQIREVTVVQDFLPK